MKQRKQHVVLTVHGIRTYGRWQERLEKLLKAEVKRSGREIDIDARHYRYGFFTLFSFLVPFLRNLAVRKFMLHLNAVLDEGPFDRVDIVAHSFGTYLAINALSRLERSDSVRIHTAILCGSVLPPDQNLSQLVGPVRTVGRVINDCGIKDGILLLTLLVYGVGMGGRLGLHGFQGRLLTNRHFNVGHSGYFVGGSAADENAFMQRWWVPVLLSEDQPGDYDERPERPPWPERIWRTLGENGAAATLSVYAVLATIFAGSLWYLRERAVEAELRALQELNRALRTQSRFLGELARQSAAAGNGVTAINLSLEGLLDLKSTEPVQRSRPHVTDAELGLDTGMRTPREIAVLDGHVGPIQSAALSRDGRHIVTASWDKTAQIFHAESGERHVALIGHKDRVWSAEFSPDGAHVVTASWDGTARIWSTDTGKVIHVLEGHKPRVWSAAFSPNGHRVVTGADDKTIRLWDAKTGALISQWEGHDQTVIKVGFSSSGRRIISVSWDGTARVWNAETRERVSVFNSRTGPLTKFSISPNGHLIAVAGRSRAVVVWDAETGKPVHTLEGHDGPVTNVAFSPDGRQLVTSGGPPYVNDKTARIWDVKTGSAIAVLSGHTGGVTGASFSPDGRLVVTASDDNTAAVWDAKSGKRQMVLAGHADTVSHAIFVANEKRVLTWSQDKTARIWCLDANAPKWILVGHKDRVDGIAFVPNHDMIITTSSDETTRIWNLTDGGERISLAGQSRGGRNFVSAPNELHVMTVTKDRTAHVWNGITGEVRAKLEGGEFSADTTSFSPDGRYAVAAQEDNSIRLFDASTGRQLRSMHGHADTVNSVEFGPGGSRLFTASKDGTARIWEVDTGKQVQILSRDQVSSRHGRDVIGASQSEHGRRIVMTFRDRTANLWNVDTMKPLAGFGISTDVFNLAYPAAFSPDSRRIVAPLEQAATGIWDAATGRMLAVLTQENWVFGSRFSKDSKRLVTYSIDHTARVWDAETGGQIARLAGHTDNVYAADFNARGDLVATASSDNTGRVWKLFAATQELVDRAKVVVPRCLSKDERKKFFLELEPPRWCITGAELENERDASKWRPKWPYRAPEWRNWLLARDRGERRAPPSD